MKSVTEKSQPHSELKVARFGKTLILQWDNRRIPKCAFTTIFLAMFWLVWVSLTLFVTAFLVNQSGVTLFLMIWLIFGYTGVLLLPLTWSQRRAIERVEIGNVHYHHSYHNWPACLHTNWQIANVTRIEFGNHDEESITTVSVRCKYKRDMIAYWARSSFRAHVFQIMRDHLKAVDSPVETVDLTEAGATEP